MPSKPSAVTPGAPLKFRTRPVLAACALAGLVIALGVAASVVEASHRGDPANPRERVPPTRYKSVTRDLQSYRPVEPLTWEELNRRVAPKPGQKGHMMDMDGKMKMNGGGTMKMNGNGGQHKH